MGKLNDKLNYLIYAGITVGTTAVVFIMMLISGLMDNGIVASVMIIYLAFLAMSIASIYHSYLQCEGIYNLNMACGLKENGNTVNRSRNYVIVHLLASVTAGIYGIYWVYRQKTRMIEAGEKYKISNQLESEEKKAFWYIVGGMASRMFGFLLLLIYITSLKRNAWSYILGGEGRDSVALRIFALLFILAGVVLDGIGYYLFYHDVNVISSAFNRETNNGNRIICIEYGEENRMNNNSLNQAGGRSGKIKILSGQYQGSEITIKDMERITIGRDASKCELVCSSEQVSRVHLSITYRNKNGNKEYIVKDMSTNGTISSKTGRLPKNRETEQPVGAVLTLGNSSESIQLS